MGMCIYAHEHVRMWRELCSETGLDAGCRKVGWGGESVEHETSKYSPKSPNENERIIVNGRGGRGSRNPTEPPMDPLLVKNRLQ